MIWAWMLWSPYALGTRTELWFGHGCSGQRMLLEHERNYDLGMDALVSVCFWNTNDERNYDLGMDALVSGCSWNTNGASPGTWRTRSQTPSISVQGSGSKGFRV